MYVPINMDYILSHDHWSDQRAITYESPTSVPSIS